jgi:hypothetical protein
VCTNRKLSATGLCENVNPAYFNDSNFFIFFLQKRRRKMETSCSKCTKLFKTPKALRSHTLLCHPEDEKELLCAHCAKKFASITARKRHQSSCAAGEIWVPPAESVTSVSISSNRHTRFERKDKERSEFSKTVMQEFKTWIMTRVTINSTPLSSKTKLGYISHVWKLIDYQEVFFIY